MGYLEAKEGGGTTISGPVKQTGWELGGKEARMGKAGGGKKSRVTVVGMEG